MLHKVRNHGWVHQSLEYKVITTQVQIEIVETNSFKATHTLLVQRRC